MLSPGSAPTRGSRSASCWNGTCGNLACTGRPFFEHTSFPVLQVAAGRREAWRQIAAAIREAIRSGQIAPGEELLSAHEMAARCRVRMAATRHAPTPPTIRQIHAILSGAFAAAVRWQWIDRNPASSAKLPKADPRSPTSPEPDQVASLGLSPG